MSSPLLTGQNPSSAAWHRVPPPRPSPRSLNISSSTALVLQPHRLLLPSTGAPTVSLRMACSAVSTASPLHCGFLADTCRLVPVTGPVTHPPTKADRILYLFSYLFPIKMQLFLFLQIKFCTCFKNLLHISLRVPPNCTNDMEGNASRMFQLKLPHGTKFYTDIFFLKKKQAN